MRAAARSLRRRRVRKLAACTRAWDAGPLAAVWRAGAGARGSAAEWPSNRSYLFLLDIALSISRFVSRSAMASRRSSCVRPFARPSSTFAHPALK